MIKRKLKSTIKRLTDVTRYIISGKAVRYDELRKQCKTLGDEKTALGKELKGLAIEWGDEDGRSHSIIAGNFKVSNQAAVKDVVDTDVALDFLEEKGLLEECTKRVLDHAALEMCIQDGEITVEELSTFMTEKVSYSIAVKKR